MSDRRHQLPRGLAPGSVQALVVDPHPLSRLGLGLVLHRQSWVGGCLLTGDLAEAVELARTRRPDVAVVDVSAAGPSIGGYLAPLRGARPSMPLVLSNLVGDPTRAQVFAAGSPGVITADLSVQAILAVVRAALLGDASGLGGRDGLTTDAPELSAREREVLALLRTGATNREIATALHIGSETVKKHARSVYRKLGVRNRTEAAQSALGRAR